MVKPITIAMLGCGFFAQNHLNAWKTLAPKGAQLMAVCDMNGAKAQAAGATFEIPAFTSVETMLEQAKPDVVDIATPMDSHRELCAMLAARGIAVIVHKPLVPDWNECIEIADTVRRHGTFLAVHENFRFQKPMQRVREIINSGVLGELSWARLPFLTGYNVYAKQPYFYDEERLTILDVGIHILDLAPRVPGRSLPCLL
jgi:predicted dehydrogenase